MPDRGEQQDDQGSALAAGQVVEAAQVPLAPLDDDPSSVVSGSPSTAMASLAEYSGVEVGLWQMTPGVMTDVEADEVFVVLSGTATVVIEPDETAPRRTLHLVPGSIVRLTAGMRTVWTVTETLRKLYVAPEA